MIIPAHTDERARRVTHEAVSGAAGADVLIGLGAATLGILGVVGVASHSAPMLALIALLAVGVAELYSGSAFGARMGAIFHH